jgi:hypothetical protein
MEICIILPSLSADIQANSTNHLAVSSSQDAGKDHHWFLCGNGAFKEKQECDVLIAPSFFKAYDMILVQVSIARCQAWLT